MPRTGGVVAPNMPHHVVQRGHIRNVVFAENRDYYFCLDPLREWTRILQVKDYAWCLMNDHDNKSIGLQMKRLAGRQTRSCATVQCQRFIR